jgi:hypothetical protein
MAAHAACADAALADDRHWDAVAGAEPGPDLLDESAEDDHSSAPARKAGCLAGALVVLLVVALLLS